MLERPGDVVMMRRQRLIGFPACAEHLVEARFEGFDETVGRVVDELLIDLDAPLRQQPDQRAEFVLVGGPAHGGERHHGSLLEVGETQVLRDAGVKHAEAVEHRIRPLALQAIAPAGPSAGGAVVAIAIGNQHGRFLEGRHEEHRRMALVVAHLHDGRQPAQTELMPQPELQTVGHIEQADRMRAVRLGSQQVEACRQLAENRAEQRAANALHVPRTGDHVDIVKPHETAWPEDRVQRHARIFQRVLDAVEALFFENDVRLAVAEKRQSGVMRCINQSENIHACSVPRGINAAADPSQPSQALNACAMRARLTVRHSALE